MLLDEGSNIWQFRVVRSNKVNFTHFFFRSGFSFSLASGLFTNFIKLFSNKVWVILSGNQIIGVLFRAFFILDVVVTYSS